MTRSLATGALLVWLLAWAPASAVANDRLPREDRDPFAPVLHGSAGGQEINPLERFAVSELKLVATVDGVDPPRALIEDPTGLGFIIKPGSVVGTERATVVSIGNGKMVLDASPGNPSKQRRIVILAGQRDQRERP